MASRPIFLPALDAPGFVKEAAAEFKWNPGFAPVQKQKNVAALHAAAAEAGLAPLLEVSTKSAEKVGVRLSAFNLNVSLPSGRSVPLECAFQGSKVFAAGGPFQDLYDVPSREAKRDPRLRDSGRIVGFMFEDVQVAAEPRTAFYDWLYVRALAPHREYLRRIDSYAGFTDIEFNPERSLNCQARSCALFVALNRSNLIEQAAASMSEFLEIIKGNRRKPADQGQPQQRLF